MVDNVQDVRMIGVMMRWIGYFQKMVGLTVFHATNRGTNMDYVKALKEVFDEMDDVWNKDFAEGYERAILDLEVMIEQRDV